MFRICKAELKKLFMKPSIFVVTGILILVLAICSFVYHPNNRNSTYITTPNNVTTVRQFYDQLNSSSVTNTFYGFNQILVNSKNFVDSYKDEFDLKEDLLIRVDRLKASYNNYSQQWISYNTAMNDPQASEALKNNQERLMAQAKQKLNQAFADFSDYYKTEANNFSDEEIHVLTTATLNLNIISFLQKCLDVFTADNSDPYFYVIQKISNEYQFETTLKNYINQLVPFIPETNYVNSLYSYIDITAERLGIRIENDSVTYIPDEEYTDDSTKGLYQQIKEKVSIWTATQEGNNSKENFEELRYLATCYQQKVDQVNNIVKRAIFLNALDKYSQQELNGFLGLEKVNYYQYKEEFVKLNYLFDTNTVEIDYANSFSIDQPSNFKVNCFDFSYFAMRLCMFIIIIYVVSMAATTIVGEQEAGTMKMLAIRPFKRRKLISGKLLSIIFIGMIMIAVSSIVTLIVGAISYGFASAPVLFVFNASSVCVVSPVVLYLIMLGTLVIEMLFFILCALAISLLFKSQIASVSLSILLFFGSLALNTVLDSAAWLRFFPFTNINLFKYFGGSFMSTQGALQKILTSPVAVGSNFWFSFIYVAVVIIALIVTVIEVFKRRDLK